MCGIIGVFNKENSIKLAKLGLNEIKNRGKDNQDFYSKENYALGHCLHSIVGSVKQPLFGKGILISNSEIYNWNELNKKYDLNAKNDSEVLLKLIEKKGIGHIKDILEELDGVYAFAYLFEDQVILTRDLIGEKPIWFSHSDGFAFASEKKALEKIGFNNAIELNPRKILFYHIKNNRIDFLERDFFKIIPEITSAKGEIINQLIVLLENSIKKRIPDRKFGVLFSGGIDSTIIALILKRLHCNFTCYTAVLDSNSIKEAEDLGYSKKAAKSLGLNLKILKFKEKDVEKYLKKIVPLVEDTNVVKVGVALPFYVACQEAKKDGCKVIFSGLGSEEIFAGYDRHKKSNNINKECISGLLKMYERDTYRDDVITMNNNLELRLPFLDIGLIKYALRIPEKYKIQGERTKIILREAASKLGLIKEISERKKKAAQYGSNSHKIIKQISKKEGFEFISDYLRQFYPKHNLRLGALVSSGKDSLYAMYVMQRQNYKISCMITLKSKNLDSYMFHTPTTDLVKLQSEASGIPFIEHETEGEKEKELNDLKKALQKAKEAFNIDGIITGALFSNYQRERIEKVADSLGLKVFSPLWHIDQETEIREIINQGFKFIITKVAAEGLDKTWLSKVITNQDVDKLLKLNQKAGLNIAFEGGEAETLVLDCPLFKKQIKIEQSEIKKDGIVATLIIKKAALVNK